MLRIYTLLAAASIAVGSTAACKADAAKVTPEQVQSIILSGVYIDAAARHPFQFVVHRLAIKSVSLAREFSGSHDKASWIKSYLRTNPALGAYVGVTPATQDVLAYMSQVLEYIPSSTFDDAKFEQIISTYILQNSGVVEDFAKQFFSRISRTDSIGKEIATLYDDQSTVSCDFPRVSNSLSEVYSRHHDVLAAFTRFYTAGSGSLDFSNAADYSDIAARITADGRGGDEITKAVVDQFGPALVQDVKTTEADQNAGKNAVAGDASAIEITKSFLELTDPATGKTLGIVAENIIKMANAASTMAADAELSMSGVGTVFVAAVAIFEAFQTRSEDPNIVQTLVYEAKILAEVKELKVDVTGLRLLVSQLYAWLNQASINDQAGFDTIEHQLHDLQDQMGLDTAKLTDAIRQEMIQRIQNCYVENVDFMTNPSEKSTGLKIIEDGSPAQARFEGCLSLIAEFALQTSGRAPFSDSSPWEGVALESIDAAPLDARVGDLSGLMGKLPSGTVQSLQLDTSNMSGRPNPIAWAWGAQEFIDLARWLPATAGVDARLANICAEAQKQERMGADAEKLISVFRKMYEDSALTLANTLDDFLLSELKARLNPNKDLRLAWVNLGHLEEDPNSEFLDLIIDYDPDRDHSGPKDVLLQAMARGLVVFRTDFSPDQVFRVTYNYSPTGPYADKLHKFVQNGWVSPFQGDCILPALACVFSGFTSRCIDSDEAYYLTTTGALYVSGGSMGQRIFDGDLEKSCGGIQSDPQDQGNMTDNVRNSADELSDYVAKAGNNVTVNGSANETQVVRLQDDLDTSSLPKIKSAILQYDADWEKGLIDRFKQVASLTSNTKIGEAARSFELARIGLDTVTSLGVSSCPSDPSLPERITNSRHRRTANRLENVADIDDIRTLFLRFLYASTELRAPLGGKLDVQSAVGSCLSGPQGITVVALLLNSVSSSYSDRLPNGCSLGSKLTSSAVDMLTPGTDPR